jgi:hypothetical protein
MDGESFMKRAAVKMIVVENINTPGRTSRVDAEKYSAMRKVLLKVLPNKAPGLTQAELREVIQPHLPQHLWPQGEKSMWWMKTVQLDLGPVNTNPIGSVASEKAPIKARGVKFGHSK